MRSRRHHKVPAATMTEDQESYSGRSVSVTLPRGLVSDQGLTECTLTRWLKLEGEYVERDEPLFEITTDKVALDLPSPTAGILRHVRVTEGETFAAAAELAVIEEGHMGA
jgi:biotin carboxyl carrier protein